jgi:hypothetical protein
MITTFWLKNLSETLGVHQCPTLAQMSKQNLVQCQTSLSQPTTMFRLFKSMLGTLKAFLVGGGGFWVSN